MLIRWPTGITLSDFHMTALPPGSYSNPGGKAPYHDSREHLDSYYKHQKPSTAQYPDSGESRSLLQFLGVTASVCRPCL